MMADAQEAVHKPEETTVGIEETEQGKPSEGAEEVVSVEALRESLEEQKAKAAEYLDQWRRTAADFANYRKRQERERQQITAWANANLLLSLLPVLDDLERALAELPPEADPSWSEGVALVERKMRATLESAGLQEIEAAEGQPFDPTIHEAAFYEESPDHQEGSILQVIRRGYRLGDRILRPAMVKVAKAPASSEGTPAELHDNGGEEKEA